MCDPVNLENLQAAHHTTPQGFCSADGAPWPCVVSRLADELVLLRADRANVESLLTRSDNFDGAFRGVLHTSQVREALNRNVSVS